MTVPDDAAYASNWLRILGFDFVLGLVAIAIGLGKGGGFVVLAVAGVVYDVAVARRFLRWRRLRRERGLGSPGR